MIYSSITATFTHFSIFWDTLSPIVIKCKLNNNNFETLVAIWSRNLLKYVIMHWPQLAGDFYQNHYYFIRAIKALTDDLCRAHTAVSALTVLKCLRLKYLTGVISFGHRRLLCKARIRRNLNIWLSLLFWRATATSYCFKAVGCLLKTVTSTCARWSSLPSPAFISIVWSYQRKPGYFYRDAKFYEYFLYFCMNFHATDICNKHKQ